MWERTLQDLIRGLRANKNDEAKFIAQAIDEIRKEIRGKDMELKAAAVMKLAYLDMLGYDMSWAAFHVVEVMSSPRIHLKSVGYLAAAQTFNEDTDVLMLTTNLLKKDLSSSPADVAVTLNGLSHIVTYDLGRDLSNDLIAMLNHSRPHIRKRAILALHRVFEKYPDAIPRGITRLQEKLDDNDPGVIGAAVNVLCELARKNPADYLPLAPHLFHLLTTSSNNWMLIKIVKLFGSLMPHEPRLVKKLQPPITDLIASTSAISLLYECLHTCIVGGMLTGASGYSLAQTCVSKLAAFLEDPDQNLKYIALLAMVKIVPTHPHLVADYQQTILNSIDDEDISIRMRALDLVSALATRDNLQSIIQQLLSHLAKSDTTMPSAVESLSQQLVPPAQNKPIAPSQQSSAYRIVLAQRIVSICSQDTYENVTDFEWYLSVLVDLAYISNVDIGPLIRDQLVDVVGRVRAARRYAVQLMVRVLSDNTFFANAREPGGCAEILWAAAWICGEFCSELSSPEDLLPYLLKPEVNVLEPGTIAVYIQAVLKIFGQWAAECAQEWSDGLLPQLKEAVDTIIERMSQLVTSPHIEVQERAANVVQLFTFVKHDLASYQPKATSDSASENAFAEGFGTTTGVDAEPTFPKSLYLISPLFSSHELHPVAPAAQASVPVPEGLDLDAWIVPEMEEKPTYEVEADEGVVERKKKGKKGKEREKDGLGKVKKGNKKRREERADYNYGETLAPAPEETLEEKAERERRKAERLERQRDDPYYIVEGRQRKSTVSVDDVDSIPVVHLDDMPAFAAEARPPPGPRLPRLKGGTDSGVPRFVVEKTGEMPKGAIAMATTAAVNTVRSASPSPSVASVLQSRLQAHSPAPGSGTQTPRSLPSFQEYEVSDDAAPATPEAIKVTKAKKKKKEGTRMGMGMGTSGGKKKRIARESAKVTDGTGPA